MVLKLSQLSVTAAAALTLLLLGDTTPSAHTAEAVEIKSVSLSGSTRRGGISQFASHSHATPRAPNSGRDEEDDDAVVSDVTDDAPAPARRHHHHRDTHEEDGVDAPSAQPEPEPEPEQPAPSFSGAYPYGREPKPKKKKKVIKKVIRRKSAYTNATTNATEGPPLTRSGRVKRPPRTKEDEERDRARWRDTDHEQDTGRPHFAGIHPELIRCQVCHETHELLLRSALAVRRQCATHPPVIETPPHAHWREELHDEAAREMARDVIGPRYRFLDWYNPTDHNEWEFNTSFGMLCTMDEMLGQERPDHVLAYHGGMPELGDTATSWLISRYVCTSGLRHFFPLVEENDQCSGARIYNGTDDPHAPSNVVREWARERKERQEKRERQRAKRKRERIAEERRMREEAIADLDEPGDDELEEAPKEELASDGTVRPVPEEVRQAFARRTEQARHYRLHQRARLQQEHQRLKMEEDEFLQKPDRDEDSRAHILEAHDIHTDTQLITSIENECKFLLFGDLMGTTQQLHELARSFHWEEAEERRERSRALHRRREAILPTLAHAYQRESADASARAVAAMEARERERLERTRQRKLQQQLAERSESASEEAGGDGAVADAREQSLSLVGDRDAQAAEAAEQASVSAAKLKYVLARRARERVAKLAWDYARTRCKRQCEDKKPRMRDPHGRCKGWSLTGRRLF